MFPFTFPPQCAFHRKSGLKTQLQYYWILTSISVILIRWRLTIFDIHVPFTLLWAFSAKIWSYISQQQYSEILTPNSAVLDGFPEAFGLLVPFSFLPDAPRRGESTPAARGGHRAGSLQQQGADSAPLERKHVKICERRSFCCDRRYYVKRRNI